MNHSGEPQIDWQRELSQQRHWLATVLLARGVEPGAVDEVFQEVCAAAIAGADKLRDSRKLAPWLYRIAVLTALQYRRRMGRHRKLARRYAEHTASQHEPEADPLQWLLAEEQRQLVRQAVEHLSPKDAEMLLLKHTEDWTYRELAEHLGISVGAVEARLHRARGKMRRALTKVAPESFSHHSK